MTQTIAQTQVRSQAQGVTAWVWQRITAALLLLLLGVHLAVLHFVPANMNINANGVSLRLSAALYLAVDSGLLALGLFHGLNGLRNVLFDFVTAKAKRRALTWALTLVGLAFLGWGAVALWTFLR